MHIRRATESDRARCARTITLAFADDPVLRWFFPDDDYFEITPILNWSMTARWMATKSLWCSDDAVAAAGWIPPGRPEVDVAQPDIEHPTWRIARFRAFTEATEEHRPEDPHWHLNMLATHPDWQRQGFGAALLSAVFDIAADAGVGCYLETESIENVAYYRHQGFAVRSEWDLPLGGPHMWGMLRPA